MFIFLFGFFFFFCRRFCLPSRHRWVRKAGQRWRSVSPKFSASDWWKSMAFEEAAKCFRWVSFNLPMIVAMFMLSKKQLPFCCMLSSSTNHNLMSHSWRTIEWFPLRAVTEFSVCLAMSIPWSFFLFFPSCRYFVPITRVNVASERFTGKTRFVHFLWHSMCLFLGPSLCLLWPCSVSYLLHSSPLSCVFLRSIYRLYVSSPVRQCRLFFACLPSSPISSLMICRVYAVLVYLRTFAYLRVRACTYTTHRSRHRTHCWRRQQARLCNALWLEAECSLPLEWNFSGSLAAVLSAHAPVLNFFYCIFLRFYLFGLSVL